MAKPTAPLMSFRASGSLAKSIVYSSWKGIPYVRSHVIPANPNTPAQQAQRQILRFLVLAHKFEPPQLHQDQESVGQPQQLTGLNVFTKQNAKSGVLGANLENLEPMPGMAGGPLPAGITVTPGATQLTVAVTLPAMPTGWTYNHTVLDIVTDENPTTATVIKWFEHVDTTLAPSHVFTGLVTAQLYRCYGYTDYTQPNGMHSISQTIKGSGTPT